LYPYSNFTRSADLQTVEIKYRAASSKTLNIFLLSIENLATEITKVFVCGYNVTLTQGHNVTTNSPYSRSRRRRTSTRHQLSSDDDDDNDINMKTA
jgi:metal-dependent amidase/aminoacylase/carboxypeptidase family protein